MEQVRPGRYLLTLFLHGWRLKRKNLLWYIVVVVIVVGRSLVLYLNLELCVQLGLGDSMDRDVPCIVPVEAYRPLNVSCGWWRTLVLVESPTWTLAKELPVADFVMVDGAVACWRRVGSAVSLCWWLFPLLLLLATNKIRFLGAFLRKLALGPSMTFGRFDLAVTMALGTVASTVGCHRTLGRYACCKDHLTWHFSLDLFLPFLSTFSLIFTSKTADKNNDKEICNWLPINN